MQRVSWHYKYFLWNLYLIFLLTLAGGDGEVGKPSGNGEPGRLEDVLQRLLCCWFPFKESVPSGDWDIPLGLSMPPSSSPKHLLCLSAFYTHACSKAFKLIVFHPYPPSFLCNVLHKKTHGALDDVVLQVTLPPHGSSLHARGLLGAWSHGCLR